MTVSNENSKRTFTGDNSTVDFVSNFKILDSSEVAVTLVTVATGAETVLTETTDYSVAGVGDSTFTVTTVATYTSDYQIVLSRAVPYTQLTDLQSNDDLPADTIEESFGDRNVMLIQQMKEILDRCIKVGITGSGQTISTTNSGVMYWDG